MTNQNQKHTPGPWTVTEIIKEPGKFQGEPSYVREFYYAWLDGASTEEIFDPRDGLQYSVFALSDAEKMEIQGADYCLIWETDQGFVEHTLMSQECFNQFKQDIEREEENGNE